MKCKFEEVKIEHLNRLLCIYNVYTGKGYSTLYEKEFTEEQLKNFLFFNNSKYKSFTIFADNTIIGFVSLAKYKNNSAYDNSAEVAVYLHPDYIHKGFGKSALIFIEEYAKTKNIHSLIATICLDNVDSIKLFESSGYQRCAHFFEVAKKFGKYLDIINYQKIL